ncbi:sodium- and chloride-dependent GABA transporter 1-like [Mizuhopecten yessoensis]|uniref:sodium- and chloride-dependent GABA transporter 1-like n=1 Tax=Mizuhopecten yessoensis TaxID=6573 RepID=UPI000B459496|nr:sodium- and chloride-dependent GABA transporter 1-like [Mizuhopecten yessoensis]
MKAIMYPNLNDSAEGERETDYIFPKGPGSGAHMANEVTVVSVSEVNEFACSLPEKCSEGSNDSTSTSTGSGNEEERATWGGKLEFLLTCICYAVGLGNVWRFPYLCYKNGGGAFLVPYTIMLGIVGLPLFFLELGIGQYASLGPISVWKMNPLLKGLGYASVIVSWLIGLYYNVIISHVLFYLYSSFTDKLPWQSCDNDWNTPNCITFEQHLNGSVNHTAHSNVSKTPSEEYYRNYVLGQTDSIDDIGKIEWHLALTLLLAWVIVCLVLLRGIQSLGKVVYFTAIFPYIMLTILFIRGVTLPGAADGLMYYFKPDFNKLLETRVWSDAATQIFYSLSACSGGLIAMSSYNKFNNNFYRDSLIVTFINCGTSIFAGMVIFAVLGFMAQEKGVDISKVADGGPGLAFVVYPEALARMPVAPLWSVFFFIMMATLGFGSEFSYVECVFSALADEFPILRERRNNIIFRVVGCIICFFLGLPMVCSGGIWLLNLVDYSVGGFPLLVVGIMELIAVAWIYGYDNFSDNIYTMLGKRPSIYWKICWKYVSPGVIGVTIILNIVMYSPPSMDEQLYPSWANALAWLIALFPIIAIPALFLHKYCIEGGFELMKASMKPDPTFGPVIQYPNVDDSFPNVGNIHGGGYNQAFAKSMGSSISTSTKLTDVTNLNFTPASSVITVSKLPKSSTEKVPNESRL